MARRYSAPTLARQTSLPGNQERLRTAMENEWIAARLSMGGSSYVSSLVHRLLRDTKERRTLAAHERALDAENEKVEK